MNNNRFYMITGMVIAIAIAISLYYANTIYSNINSADEESVVETCADIFRRNLQFTGKSLNPDLSLSEYDRKGRLVNDSIKLSELTDGKVCILLMSTNNCSGCLEQEMSILKRLNLKTDIIYLYDTPAHELNVVRNLPVGKCYEFEGNGLFPGFESMQEMPILLYVENGRIIASCIVTNYSKSFTGEFHEFLKEQFNTDADTIQ